MYYFASDALEHYYYFVAASFVVAAAVVVTVAVDNIAVVDIAVVDLVASFCFVAVAAAAEYYSSFVVVDVEAEALPYHCPNYFQHCL